MKIKIFSIVCAFASILCVTELNFPSGDRKEGLFITMMLMPLYYLLMLFEGILVVASTRSVLGSKPGSDGRANSFKIMALNLVIFLILVVPFVQLMLRE